MNPNSLRARIESLLHGSTQRFERLTAFLSFQAQLWRYCARRLRENNLLALSAALSFQTIFALIPALVLAFLVAGALGTLPDSKSALRTLLQASGIGDITIRDTFTPPAASMPTTTQSINVADEIEQIVTRVQNQLSLQRIGPIGAALFIWSALALLSTMEESLNRIFGAARRRSMLRQILLYWSVMTLGPIILAIAAYLGNNLIQTFSHVSALAWFMVIIGWVGPASVGVLLLAAVYVLMPNTRVNYRGAVGGAFVAALLWLTARAGFTLYIESFVVQGNIYGILGVFPIFLFWLNLSWTIFLFGAELAHTAGSVVLISARDPVGATVVSAHDAVKIVLTVAAAFRSGRGPVAAQRLVAQSALTAEAGHWLLRRLQELDIVCGVRGDRLTLARDPEKISLSEVWAAVDQTDATGIGDSRPHSAKLHRLIRDHAASLSNRSIADLLDTEPSDTNPQTTAGK